MYKEQLEKLRNTCFQRLRVDEYEQVEELISDALQKAEPAPFLEDGLYELTNGNRHNLLFVRNNMASESMYQGALDFGIPTWEYAGEWRKVA